MRNFGIILVLLLWVILGWKMCTDYDDCCSDNAKVAEVTVPAVVPATNSTNKCAAGIICFADNSCEPTFGSGFAAFKDSLVALIGQNQFLRISGVYDSEETYDGSAANLGECRAQSLRSSFASLSNDQIETAGQAIVGRKIGVAERFSFDIRNRESTPGTTAKSDINPEALIYFPYNSTNKLNDSAIEDYLKKVASRVKNSGEKVRLVGHTDDKGRAVKNMELGQRRANIIADYLMGEGVLRGQIIAESKGESQPAASNATEVGRAKNRRTELQIIK